MFLYKPTSLFFSLPLALLLLAAGCTGDEPAPMAEGAPDADVLGVLGVSASSREPGGKERPSVVPTRPEKAPAPAAPKPTASGDGGLKVEISEPRFDSGKASPAPRVSQSPCSSLDY